MKRNHDAPPRFERAARCVQRLYAGGEISTRWLRESLGISKAQAKRDMVELERVLPTRRVGDALRLNPVATPTTHG